MERIQDAFLVGRQKTDGNPADLGWPEYLRCEGVGGEWLCLSLRGKIDKKQLVSSEKILQQARQEENFRLEAKKTEKHKDRVVISNLGMLRIALDESITNPVTNRFDGYNLSER